MSQFVEKLKVNFEFRNNLNISTATVCWEMMQIFGR